MKLYLCYLLLPLLTSTAQNPTLTLSEKIQLLHGVPSLYTGKVKGIPHKGIPSLLMNDGPQGFRGIGSTTTQWPSALALASTWNSELVEQYAYELGAEFKEKGANVLLGPGLCISRIPNNGRTFEYLSGESPYLGATLGKAYLHGVHKNEGLMAVAKHFVLNSQETNRMSESSELDDYVLHELYLAPFEAMVKEGVMAIMCSYNKIFGRHACENNSTLQTILREEWGFKGVVMSDWFATHSAANAIKAGLDQELPYGFHFDRLHSQVKSGVLSERDIDRSVDHVLYAMKKLNVTEKRCPLCLLTNTINKRRVKLARKTAAESTVLLRNVDQTLPFAAKSKVLLVGKAAVSKSIASGGGSGHVESKHTVSIFEGLQKVLANRHNIIYDDASNLDKTTQLTNDADVVIVVLATDSQEGKDRSTLSFPSEENEIVWRLSKVQKNIIVVVVAPGAVLLPWSDSVGAIVAMFLPGQEMGNALADVLIGRENPSGKLIITFPNSDNEQDFSVSQYPGIKKRVVYSEGLLVGYRWYHYMNIIPKYPFGHGLSYSTFVYSGLNIFGTKLSFILKNTNQKYTGCEISQVYINKNILSTLTQRRPTRELIHFTKTCLQPNQEILIRVNLSLDDIRVRKNGQWYYEVLNEFEVYVGSSVLDERLKGVVRFGDGVRVVK